MSLSIDPSKFSRPEALLWSYGITAPEHIDLEAIAFSQGATVRYHSLDSCDGRIVGTDTQAIITINNRSSRARQRFSLAHEIAHWMQDRGTGSFLCTKEDIGPQKAETRGFEATANEFASQLILPNYLFDPLVPDRAITFDTAAEIGDAFGASLTATAIKLVKRSQASAFVICHSQAHREWFIHSMRFSSELWIRDELHQDSQSFAMLYGSTSGKSKVMQEPASRWLSGRQVYAMSVRTQSVKLPDGTVLTLVAVLP